MNTPRSIRRTGQRWFTRLPKFRGHIGLQTNFPMRDVTLDGSNDLISQKVFDPVMKKECMMTRHVQKTLLVVALLGTLFLLGCSGSGGSSSTQVTFNRENAMFSGGLLFHGTHVPPVQAVLAIADVYGEDGIDDLLLVATRQGQPPDGLGAFLAPGAAAGGFGEPMELGQQAIDAPGFADFDNDGLLDFVLGRFGLDVYFANGDGTFSVVDVPSLGTTSIRTPWVADFNNDGNPDVAVGGANVRVLLNRGDGSFDLVSTSMPGETWLAGPVGDYDNDGAPDLVAVTTNNATAVLRGNGDGTFAAPFALVTDGLVSGVTSADLNLDGRPDIVSFTSPLPGVIGEPFEFVCHLSRGDGTFDEVRTETPFGGLLSATTIGDVTDDGIPDAVINGGALFGFSGTRLLPGIGDGTFAPPVELKSTIVVDSIIGDFTGDGVEDIYGRGLIEGLGGGAFYEDPSFAPAITVAWAVAADVYGDGRPDFVVGNEAELQIFTAIGDGTFRPTVPVALPPSIFSTAGIIPIDARTADMDGDGLDDVLLAQPSVADVRGIGPGPCRIISVLIRADGTVELSAASTGAPVVTIGDLVDVDGDGALDLLGRWTQDLFVFPTNESGWVTFGEGDGTFAGAIEVTSNPTREVPQHADLDGDGSQSVIARRATGGVLDIYNVASDRSVSFGGTIDIGSDGSQFTAGRLDTDTRDDVAVVFRDNLGTGQLRTFFGTAANLVEAGQQFPLGNGSNWTVDILDLDGNGSPYIVVTRERNDDVLDRAEVRVFRRTGARTFTPLPPFNCQIGLPGNFVMADFTFDGINDLVSHLGNTIQVLRGQGAGRFELPLYFDVDEIDAAMTAGDWDSDGDLDLAFLAQEVVLKMNRLIP